MKRKQTILLWMVITWIAAVLLRVWNLKTGYDAEGLPVSGTFSTWCLAILSILIVVTYLLLSVRLRRDGCNIAAVVYSNPASIAAFMGAALLLVSVLWDFIHTSNNQIIAIILLILGLLSGLCLFLLAICRGRGQAVNRAAELVPILYLLVKLIIDFKGWSIDPIILDYCIRLFAMICILLSFYYAAGFTFSLPAPARTCFFTAAGVFFSCAAIAEGILSGSIADLLFYLGCFLWMIPVLTAFTGDSEAA